MFGFDKLSWRACLPAAFASAFFFFPASAQPVARPDYMVFFDFEVSGVTPAARDVIALAVKSAKEKGAKVVYVVGHADGFEHHPERLSFKRARNVRDQLLSLGLSDSTSISVEGRGFYKPLVATHDREPQNRLVEIYISEAPSSQSADTSTLIGREAVVAAGQDAASGTEVSHPSLADGFYLALEDGSGEADAVTIPDATPNAPALRLSRKPLVPGTDIQYASVTADAVGRMTVDIELTQSGADLMSAATSTNVGHRMAIVVGGVAISVSTVQTPITGGRFEISGQWTLAQANALASQLQRQGPK